MWNFIINNCMVEGRKEGRKEGRMDFLAAILE
jgi:hypothetical protein